MKGETMISDELAGRFGLPHITKYRHDTRTWYNTFLIQSDYIVTKAMEAQLSGEDMPEGYTDIMAARAECRKAINALDAGTYEGEEAGTEEDEENVIRVEDESVVGFEFRDGKLVQVEGDPADIDSLPEEVKAMVAQYAGKEE